MTDLELKHFGVKGMKWGVRKDKYKAMNKQQRKKARQAYLKTPEGRVERATVIGTILGGPIIGSAVGMIAAKKVGMLDKKTVNNGKKKVNNILEKHENAKIETDEQKITRLMNEGKTNPNARYTFDQNGRLFMVTWD